MVLYRFVVIDGKMYLFCYFFLPRFARFCGPLTVRLSVAVTVLDPVIDNDLELSQGLRFFMRMIMFVPVAV